MSYSALQQQLVDDVTGISGVVPMWVITHKTKDYGEKYVVRRHASSPGRLYAERDPVAVCDDLDEARKHVPKTLFRSAPQPGDDPVIVEYWF